VSVQAVLIRRRDDAFMLSPATLAAFSAGVSQAQFGQASPVHRVRAVNDAKAPQAASSTAPQILAPNARGGDDAPDRALPRGSLLDLSV
jgi:hypothetical protein